MEYLFYFYAVSYTISRRKNGRGRRGREECHGGGTRNAAQAARTARGVHNSDSQSRMSGGPRPASTAARFYSTRALVLCCCFACLGWGRAYLPASPRHRWPPGARAPQGPARQRQPDARCAPARAAACTHPPVAAAACFIVCSVSCTVLLCHHAHLH
jgi:hypothetical protein